MRYFSYAVVSLLIVFGVLVIAGVFAIDPNLRLVFGSVFIGYGVIRLLTMRRKYRRRDEIQDPGMEK